MDPVIAQMIAEGAPYDGGWVDTKERFALAATLPSRTFSQAAPGLMAQDNDKDVFLYKAWKQVLGDYPKYPGQVRGDCTSFGSGHTLDLLQCIEITLDNQPLGYQETCTEAIYGIGREIAGMLGGGEGCYGVAVAKALVQFGAVPRKFVGAYDGNRVDQWGSRGVPQSIKAEAAKYKLGATTLVTTPDEADAALASLHPFIVCSNQGFTLQRDQDGVCQPKGHWAHCLSVSGRRRKNGRRQYCIDQSWGTNDGPPGPYGPLSDDQPPFSFWADEDVVASMLAGQDSLAFSSFPGFEVKPRPLPDKWSNTGFA